MTEDANGSATVVEPDAGVSAAANGNGDQGSKAAPADPFSGLDPGIREWIGNAGLKLDDPAKLVSDLVVKTRGAETLIGKSVQLPGDDAGPEDWNKFFGRLGRPEKPDGYGFQVPDEIKDSYDAGFTEAFRGAAHQAGLTPKQASVVHDWYVGMYTDGLKQAGEARTAEAAEATRQLEKAFGGARDSEAFRTSVGLIGRVLQDQGEAIARDLKQHGIDVSLKDGLIEAGALGEVEREDGAKQLVVLNAPVGILLSRLGKALYSEDGLDKGGGGSPADNPFKDGPGMGNQTVQMQMIASDRAQAVRLIQLAGHKPEDWGIAA